MILTEVEIIQRLAEASKSGQSPESPYLITSVQDPPQPAAVLIPFLCTQDGWQLLFIRRTLHPLDRHSGQVAFPGGRCDPEDPDAVKAALREAHEEVGLIPKDVRVLGRLREMLTITNYRVTPIVGAIPWPYELRPQPEEVSRIFTIPLEWLADPDNHEIQQHRLQHHGKPLPVIQFQPYDGEILWGVSARITMLLLEALGLLKPEHRYKSAE
ncbi:MAG: CoA pyrophosphatase [Chloroflexi bacterium]|nr:CoA pyrophosphatase [Chloroflexota bacterium]